MKLSIIVPVYNTEDYVAKCLDSLLKSDDGDYEIIAVNDGSQDSSREILGQYEESRPDRIRIIDKPNGGLGDARNAGIEAAKGDNLLFVDSDDYLADNAVAEIMAILEESFDIAVFDFVHVDETGKVTAAFDGSGKKERFTLDEYPEFLFSPHNAVNKIWKRRLFTETGIRFEPRIWYEDLALSPKLYTYAKSILPVHKAWYCYLQRRGSITNNSSATRNGEMITVTAMVLDYYRENGLFERYRDQLGYKFFYEEFLASVTRVNLIDPKSEIQAALRDDYISHFPDYHENPYVREIPPKYRILERLIRKGKWNAVHLLMNLNNTVKGR